MIEKRKSFFGSVSARAPMTMANSAITEIAAMERRSRAFIPALSQKFLRWGREEPPPFPLTFLRKVHTLSQSLSGRTHLCARPMAFGVLHRRIKFVKGKLT